MNKSYIICVVVQVRPTLAVVRLEIYVDQNNIAYTCIQYSLVRSLVRLLDVKLTRIA